MLSDSARELGCQIIAASHSEVILNEAADRDMVIAFIGKPHRIDDRGSQGQKALREFGFEQYYQAEQTGWVLYLEGSTDLAILREFAATLHHAAADRLSRVFVHYIANQLRSAESHFYALREAKPELVGFAVVDRLERGAPQTVGVPFHVWKRREIENYLCDSDTLLAWVADFADAQGPLFKGHWQETMRETIGELERAMATLRKDSPWSPDAKVSDDFLAPLFEAFFGKIGLPNLMRKSGFYTLARHVPAERIDPEVTAVLDRIVETAERADPAPQ